MHYNDDELLTNDEMAAVRRVPPSRQNKERLTGDGPPFLKQGHLVRYRWGDYREWLATLRRATSTTQMEAA